jgi:hypothetical protein
MYTHTLMYVHILSLRNLLKYGRRSRYNDLQRAGWSVNRFLVGGEIFCNRPGRPWGPPSLLYNEYRVIPRGKAAEAWCKPPKLSSAEVKERVELHLYSLSEPLWPVTG